MNRLKTMTVIALAAGLLGAAGMTATGTASAGLAAPSEGQLTDKLRLVVNRAADRNARMAELVDPGSIRGADNIGALNDSFSWAFRWKVVNPSADGDALHAQLAVTLVDGSNRQGQVQNYPLTWAAGDGSWKLTKDTVCGLAQRFQTTC